MANLLNLNWLYSSEFKKYLITYYFLYTIYFITALC